MTYVVNWSKNIRSNYFVIGLNYLNIIGQTKTTTKSKLQSQGVKQIKNDLQNCKTSQEVSIFFGKYTILGGWRPNV